jgi:hypothetical protein
MISDGKNSSTEWVEWMKFCNLKWFSRYLHVDNFSKAFRKMKHLPLCEIPSPSWLCNHLSASEAQNFSCDPKNPRSSGRSILLECGGTDISFMCCFSHLIYELYLQKHFWRSPASFSFWEKLWMVVQRNQEGSCSKPLGQFVVRFYKEMKIKYR